MGIKWPRRRLLSTISVVSAFTGAIFPEMGFKAYASTNDEQPNPAWSKLQLVEAQEITGAELTSLNTSLTSSPDVVNCGGPLDFNKAEFKAVRHRIANTDNHFLATIWFFSSTRHALVYWQLDEAVDQITTRSFLYQFDTKGEKGNLMSLSINTLPLKRTAKSASSSQTSQSQVPCNDWWDACSDNPNCTCSGEKYTAPICGEINIGYIAGCCGSCIFAGELVAACALVFCPVCIVANACSTVTGTSYCCK